MNASIGSFSAAISVTANGSAAFPLSCLRPFARSRFHAARFWRKIGVFAGPGFLVAVGHIVAHAKAPIFVLDQGKVLNR